MNTQEKYTETQEQLRKAKIKAERLEILNPFLQFVDLSAFDLSTMSDVAFTTIKNGAEYSFNLHVEQQEKLRIEQEEVQAKVKLYAERKMKLAPYSFYAKSEDTLSYDTDHEQFLFILKTLQDRKKQDDDHKELLAKQNADLQKQVQKTEKKVETIIKKSQQFEAIAKSNIDHFNSEFDIIKKQHADMKLVLEEALKYIIPSQLRKLIETTLKF